MEPINYNYTLRHPLETKIIGWGKSDSDNGTGIKSMPDLRVNNFDFRCDDFTKNHIGEHILFSGCSITYGTGLLESEIWSKILYEKILKDKQLSGYFNLGMPGTGTIDIVINIFKYINSFGNPSTIFINLPNVHRAYLYDDIGRDDKQTKGIKHVIYKDNFLDPFARVLPVYTFQYLFMLEMYCKSNNINLYYFSWSDDYYHTFDLKNFIKTNNDDLCKYVAEYKIDNENDQYSLIGRDEKHYGTAYHQFWAEQMYNIYMKDNKNVN